MSALAGAHAQDGKSDAQNRGRDKPDSARGQDLPTGKQAAPGAAGAKVKVYRQISRERLEDILKDMGISFQKTPDLFSGTLYDFTRNNSRMRLQYFNGSDLHIDAVYTKIPLEDVNRWNRTARLSRAVLVAGPPESVSLEAELDCTGGVTDGMVRQFILNFDKEVLAFVKFWQSIESEEEVFQSASAERVEKIFKGLGFAFKKTQVKGVARFEFQRSTHKVQLHCHNAGAVLVLEAAFPKLSLEKINKYNYDRRYIRVALRQDAKGKDFTTLECYLDCQGGVTESIVRNFLTIYERELKDFERNFTEVSDD
ncbi:MAG: YbjN domain-containing protein [Gemmataceae bacterium]|nr:YbjN domain-containing protein [Gemmataceae bacterium]MCI0738345.1 YbjN domain-containing protein [Gemmataceae bacterium]